jgi:transposase
MGPRRNEPSDFEWLVIQPLLPYKPRGVPRADDRRVLNGIYWWLRTGSLWVWTFPERYGPCTTCADTSSALGREWRPGPPFCGWVGDWQMIDASSVRLDEHAGNVKTRVRMQRQPRSGVSSEPSAWGARTVV